MKPKKKRTRRAVNARRTAQEREQAAEKHLTTWMCNLKIAMRKVEHYQNELRNARRKQASQEAETVFGETQSET